MTLDIKDRLIEIVREAARLMEEASFEITNKEGYANIVTSTDVAVQEYLCKHLKELLPGSGFLCEEDDIEEVDELTTLQGVQEYRSTGVQTLPSEATNALEPQNLKTSKPEQYTWIIDPIDGTANFARGIDQCAICVGLGVQEAKESSSGVQEYRSAGVQTSPSEANTLQPHNLTTSQPHTNNSSTTSNSDSPSFGGVRGGFPATIILGIVYIPRTNELFYAERGKGAFRNGKQIHVSDRPFANGILCTALPVYHKEYAPLCSKIILEAFTQCNDIRRFGACAPELCYLAMGRCEMYFEYLLSPWDFAAASLILTEAGGVIADLNGNAPTYLHPSGIVAANNKENLDRMLGIVNS
ncbi:MAG: hypothetical protein IKA00_08275 [Prevotella sp.]|nr:hypothetical protein [Prevotella sp.]